MRLSIWKPGFLSWIIPGVSLLIVFSLVVIFKDCFNLFKYVVAVSSIFTLLCFIFGSLLFCIKRRYRTLKRVLLTYKNFVFYHDVKNPDELQSWLIENTNWFRVMLKDLIKYLRINGIGIKEEDINKTVYIKFKDIGKVGYYDPSGVWIKCFGFQRRGYIEVEWGPEMDQEYFKSLIRHEVAHFLIDSTYPNLSEKTHHRIMGI
jgi:hypothetical protein